MFHESLDLPFFYLLNCTRLQKEYASEIAGLLSSQGIFADVDNGGDTLPKKIRNGEIAQYNYLLGRCSFGSDAAD